MSPEAETGQLDHDQRFAPLWYVLRTRSRHEKTVRDQLVRREVETFLPIAERWSHWKDRRKKVAFPLFPGYCFARFPLVDRLRVLNVVGVAAPTTNTDGSKLADLGFYRVYYGPPPASPCPGGTFFQVASSTSTPPIDQTVNFRLTGLTTNSTYRVSVTAVDTAGNESACSLDASAVAQVDIGVTPTTTVNFGCVNLGSSATQSFTVQSTRSGTIAGTASVGAPFSIVSGSPFTLVGTGATATVTVRFTPTSTATASTNVNFTADGDTLSRLVTGTGATLSSTLTVSKSGTGNGSVTSSPAGITCGSTCATAFAAFGTGTTVTLTATPAAGSTFTGWSGGGCSGTGSCIVTMSAARAVTATFTAGSAGGFTDNSLVASTTVGKAVHVTELRTAINAARMRHGLAAFAWTDPTLTPGSTMIRAIHIVEMRTALSQVYTRLGRTLPAYTDPTIVPGRTVSKAAHIQELRAAVTAVP